MKFKILAVVILLGFIIIFSAKAQSDYKFGVGLRVGWPTGVTAKYFFSDSWALEGIVTGRYRGIGTTFLLEKQNSLGDDFQWYVGGGFHGAFYSGQYYNGPRKKLYDEDSYSFGIDGVVGLEYSFNQVPITIGADVKPAFEINYGPYFSFGSAVNVRYIF